MVENKLFLSILNFLHIKSSLTLNDCHYSYSTSSKINSCSLMTPNEFMSDKRTWPLGSTIKFCLGSTINQNQNQLFANEINLKRWKRIEVKSLWIGNECRVTAIFRLSVSWRLLFFNCTEQSFKRMFIIRLLP